MSLTSIRTTTLTPPLRPLQQLLPRPVRVTRCNLVSGTSLLGCSGLATPSFVPKLSWMKALEPTSTRSINNAFSPPCDRCWQLMMMLRVPACDPDSVCPKVPVRTPSLHASLALNYLCRPSLFYYFLPALVRSALAWCLGPPRHISFSDAAVVLLRNFVLVSALPFHYSSHRTLLLQYHSCGLLLFYAHPHLWLRTSSAATPSLAAYHACRILFIHPSLLLNNST